MFRLSTEQLEDIVDLLERSHMAIHRMERACSYKTVYEELRKDIQDSVDDLKARYALDEFTDDKARDKALEDIKKEADDNWEQYKSQYRVEGE
jgi:hypothetical protein